MRRRLRARPPRSPQGTSKTAPRRSLTQAQVGLREGFRSGLEEQIAAQLKQHGITEGYEVLRIPFVQPTKPRRYTPDWVLPNGIILELKGRFITADRAKHLLVKAQYPDLDIRFVFSNSRTRISKQSQTTYGRWAETKGFLFADRYVPEAWLKEAPNKTSLAAIKRLMEERS